MNKTTLLAATAFAAAFWLGLCGIAAAQSPANPPSAHSIALATAPDRESLTTSISAVAIDAARSGPGEPAAPDPAGRYDQPDSSADMIEGWSPLSRIAVGSGLGLVGVNVRGAVLLTRYFDARLDGTFFSYSPVFQINGFNVQSHFRLASVGARLDWYPTDSVWRISPGVMLYNGNAFSGSATTDPGTSVDLNGTTYYSADPKKVSGATPVSGIATLGLNRNKAAFTLTGGFGRYIPRSHRHWSFPTELGVAFTGAPTLDVKLSGWVCTDSAELNCSNLSSPTNPVAIQFNNSLNIALARWRHDLGVITVYPILSSGVMYSFDLK